MGGWGEGEGFKGRLLMRALLSVVVAVVALAVVGCGGGAQAEADGEQLRSGRIEYAVDGDTLRVRLAAGDLVYVRLVGIDTPEEVRPEAPVECGGRAAAASMDRLAPEGAFARLRMDSVAAEYDHYGRLLAHAFVDGHQLELAQLRRGWADVYRFEGQSFDGLARFRAAETAARFAGRGVWGLCGGDFHSSD